MKDCSDFLLKYGFLHREDNFWINVENKKNIKSVIIWLIFSFFLGKKQCKNLKSPKGLKQNKSKEFSRED